MTIIRESAICGGKEITLETGRMARQAAGSVVIQLADSQVLCTAAAADESKDASFFPLTVNYQENFWAAGEIPGNFFRREGRPGDKATLTSRLIDRPCRPLFPDSYRDETQLIAWVISADKVNDTDVLSITGCSAALMLSDIPWEGPVAGVRVGLIDGEFVANPTFEERQKSDMDIVVVCTQHSIIMVEGEANEVPDSVVADALVFAQEAVQGLLDMQVRLAEKVGKPKRYVEPLPFDEDLYNRIKSRYESEIFAAVTVPEKIARYKGLALLKERVEEELLNDLPFVNDLSGDEKKAFTSDVGELFGQIKKEIVRALVINENKRLDGRALDEIRPITIETGLIPKAHGSALFTRGETQALVTLTLGTDKDAKLEDGLEGVFSKKFMLHYNFPPFCVGEARPMRSTSRREVGHGMLAERALTAGLPDLDSEFPYTVRIVSDILESNGSSSMASVCGGSLALMDGGVPVKFTTAGIAMGLIKEDDEIRILSDILGDEDHLGDMDFKVCGTEKGITAFQLDTKIAGISKETMLRALEQAKAGRIHILEKMKAALPAPRNSLNENAPRIITIQIAPSSIGAVIGQGGSTIRGIQEATGTQISIEDDGTVSIASSNAVAAQQAIEIIEELTATPEVGQDYLGTVQKVVDFGAFIEILPGTDGLCHISELTDGRVNRVEDVLREGDEVLVRVMAIDRGGKIKLSRRAALADQGDSEGSGDKNDSEDSDDDAVSAEEE